MSPQDSNSRGLLSRIDVYTVMLGVALLAIVLGCVLLSLELGRYKWNVKAKGVAQAAAPRTLLAAPRTLAAAHELPANSAGRT